MELIKQEVMATQMNSENQELEFKQIWKDYYLKTICAFANGDGGHAQNKYGKTWDDIAEDRFSLADICLDTIEKFKRRAADRVPDIAEEKDTETLLREAIINALIHRDYTDTSNLQIRVYDDKLVMYNGATLSREVPIELFDQPHQSKPFNPTMAAVFYKCGYIENWGRGTLNIIDYCLQAGLPKPEFAYQWGAVRTTFFKKEQITPSLTPPDSGHVGVNVGVNVGVTDEEKELLTLIEQHQPINAASLASHYPSVTQRTVERWLKQLRDKDLIEFRGAPKTGGYYLTQTFKKE